MCDGFSEAFMAAAAGASEGVGAMAGGYSALAGIGESLGSAAAFAGTHSGALAAIGSAGMSAYSGYSQANASQAAANYQAQIQQNNAVLAGYQRSAALQQGQSQAEAAMLQQSQILGEQRATLTSNGIKLDSGSAVDQLATTRFLAGQDLNTLQANAARAAWGYSAEAGNNQAQGQLLRWQAANNNPAAIAGINAGASLLSSASLYALGSKTNLFNSLLS
ncbi:hypothetical protein KEF85_06210 [Methylomonas paludis]|uniref:Uncharacterized protein n=1 Tax=Methylomonas paludis TaxID=1173101 RepID=A0A975MQB2_9GAMM|nr:hypothetical protein [Methylomonas paludis]QWF72046.1 hypothetical protein KEF85_06210 [Methylomonas paludis]